MCLTFYFFLPDSDRERSYSSVDITAASPASKTGPRYTTDPELDALELPPVLPVPLPPEPVVPPPFVAVPPTLVPFETDWADPLSWAKPMASGLYRNTEYTFLRNEAPTIQLIGDWLPLPVSFWYKQQLR